MSCHHTLCIDHVLKRHGYWLRSKIGKGKYSNVYLVKQRGRYGEVANLACKIVNKNVCSAEFLEKFFPRELRILSKINHPNVIRTERILKKDPYVFIVMQYATRGDLFSYIVDFGPMEESSAKKWFFQLISGLRYLHEIGIAHRDIKCENIFISGTGTIVLGDLGLAKQCRSKNASKGFTHLSHTFCGSIAYAAPEVIAAKPYDPMVADVWSAGVVLFVMLNAQLPFRERNNLRRLVKLQKNRQYNFNTRIRKPISESALATITLMLDPIARRRIRLDEL